MIPGSAIGETPAGPSNVPQLELDPFDEAFLADPYASHDALRDAGPVVWLNPIGAFAMARHDEVRAALADHNTYCSSRGVGLADFCKEAPYRPPSLLLEADPPLHDRTRELMNGIVSIGSLRELRATWAARAEALVDDLVGRRRFDAVTDLGEVYPMQVFPDAVGVPQLGREHLLTYAAAVFDAFGPRNAVQARSHAAAEGAFSWVAEACRKENLSAGGWGIAVHEAAERGECTPEEAERLVRSLLSAGVDTTVNGIGHLVFALATHPDQWAALKANPGLGKKAFEESLRWNSTVQTFFRTTTREAVVSGVSLPEGAKVLLFLAAANRDPRAWGDPESFDIARSAMGHVAFGHGIHVCLGMMVARLEAELVLAALVKHVASIRLTAPPRWRLNNTLRALESLPVEVEPS